MKKLKILFLIVGIGLIAKIGLYQICKTLDKGVTSYSSTLAESKSNDYLIDNYRLIEAGNEEKLEFNKFKLNSIFVEKKWNYQCDIWRFKKVPKVIYGQNIVLPIKANSLDTLDSVRFYLVNESDTIILRGNRMLETAFYDKSLNTYGDLEKSELILTDKNGILVAKFNLKKEKN